MDGKAEMERQRLIGAAIGAWGLKTNLKGHLPAKQSPEYGLRQDYGAWASLGLEPSL